jgi:hypothetical protein
MVYEACTSSRGNEREICLEEFIRLTYFVCALQSRVGGPNAASLFPGRRARPECAQGRWLGLGSAKTHHGRLHVCVIFKRACERCCFAFHGARRFIPWKTPLGSWSRRSTRRTCPEGDLEISANVMTSFDVARKPPKVNWPWGCLSTTTPTTPHQAIVAHITTRGQHLPN